jgi:hypothetical protein
MAVSPVRVVKRGSGSPNGKDSPLIVSSASRLYWYNK